MNEMELHENELSENGASQRKTFYAWENDDDPKETHEQELCQFCAPKHL